MFEYQMVEIPPGVMATKSKRGEGEAAAYLQEIVNREAREGWEFQRVDQMNVQMPAGCMGMSNQGETRMVYVITFRRPGSDVMAPGAANQG